MTTDRLFRIVALRMRTLFRRNDVERELDDELRYHVDRQTEENMRRGMSPSDARRAAVRAIGGFEFRKDQVRDTRGMRWLDEIVGDARCAARSLTRSKGFAATVIITLALGIGANTAMFTILRGTLLRPLPNRDGNRLLYLRQAAHGVGQENVYFSVPEVADYRNATTLAELAEYSNAMPFTMVGSDGHAARIPAGVITGNYFDVMGLEPVAGRLIRPSDDGAAAAPVAVLSFQFWNERFGGDTSVIGRVINLNDRAVTIVGVVEPVPPYPDRADLYVNTVTSPHHLSATMVTGRTHRMSEVFARLAPNATVQQARDELARLSTNVFRDHPEAYEKAAKYEITATPLATAVNARAVRTFWLLMGGAMFVLLIACANVANLTLMRGVGREREMFMRAALGAGTFRLRRLLLVENLLLALVGGALGVLVALAGLRILVGFAAQFSPRATEIRVDGLVLAVGLVTGVVVASILSLAPRIWNERSLGESAAAFSHRSTLGRGRQRLQRSLVVAQIAVCMVLVTGAGLLVRTIGKLQAVDSGVRVDHVLTVELPLSGDLMKAIVQHPENLARYERIRERVAALPGVERAGLGWSVPLGGTEMSFDMRAEGRSVPPDRPTPHADLRTADANYFAAAGIPVLRGRPFATTDQRGSQRVAIISQSFAKEVFGDDDPIGKRISPTGEVLKFTPLTDEWRTVVGVVGDIRDQGLEKAPSSTVYEPFAQEIIFSGALIVRTTADPALVQSSVLRVIRESYPRQLISKVATIEHIRDESVAPRRLNAMFVASFGGLAFIIAMVGIAGVLAFSVSSRIPEIGVRMSLGADAGRVRRMVLGEGGSLLVLGLIVGIGGALLAARLLRTLLFGVTPNDPTTLVTAAFLLAGVGLFACWIPAERAASVDPADALRAE